MLAENLDVWTPSLAELGLEVLDFIDARAELDSLSGEFGVFPCMLKCFPCDSFLTTMGLCTSTFGCLGP